MSLVACVEASGSAQEFTSAHAQGQPAPIPGVHLPKKSGENIVFRGGIYAWRF